MEKKIDAACRNNFFDIPRSHRFLDLSGLKRFDGIARAWEYLISPHFSCFGLKFRVPSVRCPTPLLGAADVTPTEFHQLYDKRLRRYARRLASEWKLPASMREDLYQTCWLIIPRQLAKWDPEGGMSAFNWCASRMKREMTAEYRRYHANPAYGWRRELNYFQQPLGEREAVAEHVDLDLRIDVTSIIDKQDNPRQCKQFIRVALSDANGAELAEETGMTRQGVNSNLRVTGKRLNKAFALYATEAPSNREDARRSVAWTADWRNQVSTNAYCGRYAGDPIK